MYICRSSEFLFRNQRYGLFCPETFGGQLLPTIRAKKKLHFPNELVNRL